MSFHFLFTKKFSKKLRENNNNKKCNTKTFFQFLCNTNQKLLSCCHAVDNIILYYHIHTHIHSHTYVYFISCKRHTHTHAYEYIKLFICISSFFSLFCLTSSQSCHNSLTHLHRRQIISVRDAKCKRHGVRLCGKDVS